MKTLLEIKNHYAQELGCKDWQDLIMKTWSDDDMEKYYDEICIRAQRVALEKKIERIKSLRSVYDAGSGQHNILSILIYEFETNPENLIL